MRLIGWKQLKELQPLSRTQITRLEQAGKFPKRVLWGARVMWVYDEVVRHLQEVVARRNPPDPAAP